MKKTTLFSLGFGLLSTVLLQADLVLVQNFEGEGQKGEMTMKVKEGKMRVDMGGGPSIIIDTKTGDMLTLVHAQKMAMKMDGAILQKMQAAAGGGKEAPVVELVATGKTEKVGAIDTEIYTLAAGQVKGTYWIAKDYPNAAKILSVLQEIQESPVGKMGASMAPLPKSYPGVPVKSEIDMGGAKVTSTLTSVKEENVEASQFEIPAGYQEMKMPTLPTPSPTAP